ncbi:MAG: hypothetical protein SWK90_13010 [Chloroflexota bacterium]|nr:hypothetical protein [Chloroflexota bacterium]
MKRSIWIASGVVVLALLLASTAFMVGQLSNDPEAVVMEGPNGSKIVMADRIEIEHAKEMPNASPDIGGLFVRHEGSSLYVGTGNLSGVVVDGDQEGASRWDISHDGPVVEMITTHDTLVYRDDTLGQIEGRLQSDPIQQVLVISTLDEIGKDSIVSAWGERHGDRVVAEVIVFSSAVWR